MKSSVYLIFCLFCVKQFACAETEGNVDGVQNVEVKELGKPNLRTAVTGFSDPPVMPEDEEVTQQENCSDCNTPTSTECTECESKCSDSESECTDSESECTDCESKCTECENKCPESCDCDNACPEGCVVEENCKGDDCSGSPACDACDACEKECEKEQTGGSVDAAPGVLPAAEQQTEQSEVPSSPSVATVEEQNQESEQNTPVADAEPSDASPVEAVDGVNSVQEPEEEGTQVEQDPLILTEDPEEAQRIMHEMYSGLSQVEDKEETVSEENDDEGDDQVVDENGQQQESEEESEEDEKDAQDDEGAEGNNTLIPSNDTATDNSEIGNTKTENENLVDGLVTMLKEDNEVDESVKVLAQDMAQYFLNNMDEGNGVA
ncbi:Uncharacterized protein PCOAH_00013520 [Plasmodium coatneyi]|uniref:SICA antigen n=1 Tax=Plasmodium coatneyi TaxID=208452 RepID=A0A1B1DWR2_9APIC|nr:Uncharacterized protein PCOAH_00013520 [Plasmodium coatneyi]ANQ07025.1 Uncharacterized protein PCOAH_00013520 [Plasmodium coatneyi]